MWHKCATVNVERARDAARRYAILARDTDLSKPLFDGDDDKTRKLPAWSSAMLFRAVGHLDAARDMTMFRTGVDQASPDGWKFRAEVERQIGIDEWAARTSDTYCRLSWTRAGGIPNCSGSCLRVAIETPLTAQCACFRLNDRWSQ